MEQILGWFFVLGGGLTAKSQITGWTMPGECFEFFVKMRLIVEMGLVGHERPIHRVRWIETVQYVLKAIQTCYFFRSPTDHPLELSDQVFLADADLVAQVSNQR